MKEIRNMQKARAAAVFTDAEVRAIRRADEAGLVSRLEQARTYGVGKETIARICRGETYYWVAQEEELFDEMYKTPKDLPEEMKSDAMRVLAAAIKAQNEMRPDNLLKELNEE